MTTKNNNEFSKWMDNLLEGLIDLVKEFPNKEMNAKIRFLKIIIAKHKEMEDTND